MSQYRITALRRTYYCDAEDIAAALRHFVANVPDAAVETIVDLAAEQSPAETPQQRYVRAHGKVYPEPGTIDHKPIKRGALGQLP